MHQRMCGMQSNIPMCQLAYHLARGLPVNARATIQSDIHPAIQLVIHIAIHLAI